LHAISVEVAGARLQRSLDRAPFQELTLPDGTLWASFYRAGENFLLRFPGLADFEISSDGLNVRCWPMPRVSPGTIDHIYLNQVQPFALSLQGRLVLHASAVEVNGSAIAFMGASGQGKSTLAASFVADGFRFLTDDGLHLEATTDGYLVLPSHPSIRLWDDSRAALISESAKLATPVQYTSKARILADNTLAFCDEPRPLRRIYFLGDDHVRTPAFEPLGTREAMIQLTRQTFLLDTEARESLALHFDQLVRLIRLAICFRLDYPRRYAALAQVKQAILQHAMSDSPAGGA